MAPARIQHLQPETVLEERYRLLKKLGSGSMAEVWQARDQAAGRDVAIKVVAELLAPSEHAHRRFEREALAIGMIHHPNVVALLGHGAVADGRPFLVMEVFEGETLAAYLARTVQLGALSAAALAAQMLQGLIAAHEVGVIHRDLKPANILLARIADGRRQVKILDFGVARILDLTESAAVRLTATGTVLGSPRYMPLEAARGDPEVDERCDIFGAGAVVYHALAGTPPFVGRSLGEVMRRVLAHDIASLGQLRPDLPGELVACVERALAARPGDRFSSAREMHQAIMAVLQTLRQQGTQ